MHLFKNTKAVLNTHNLFAGFTGEIFYGPASVSDPDRRKMLKAMVHEHFIHAANQYARVPATHGTPFNRAAKTVLTPRSAAILNIIKERQAFGVETLVDELLDEMEAGTRPVGDVPPPVELEKRLQTIATYIDLRQQPDGAVRGVWHNTGWRTPRAFFKFYVDSALGAYEGPPDDPNSNVNYLRNKGVQFAKIGLVTVRQINECYGMHTFGRSDAELSRLIDIRFTAQQERRIRELNRLLGIDEDRVPYFEDALAASGETPEHYLQAGLGKMARKSGLSP